MDPLSGAASVLTIIDAIARVTKFIVSCKNATTESQRLLEELSQTRGVLTTLQDTLEERDDTKDLMSDSLKHQFKQLLNLLEIGLSAQQHSTGFKKLKLVIRWPYREPETLKLVSAVERYKTMFGLLLKNGVIQRTTAIQDEIKALAADCTLIKEELRLGTEHLDAIRGKTVQIAGAVEDGNQQLEALKDKAHELGTNILDNSQQLSRLNVAAQDAEYEQIFRWLSSWNFWNHQDDTFSSRIQGTGEWFLESRDFTEWLSTDAGALFCRGPPGVGKSTLSSLVIHHLEKTLPKSSLVLGYFCDHSDTSKTKEASLFGSLLQQLIKHHCSTWDKIKDLYKSHRHRTTLPPRELRPLILDEIQTWERVYLVLDALDEWSTEPEELTCLVSDLLALGSNVNILVTSRPIGSLDELFQKNNTVDIFPPRSDLELYLRSRIAGQHRCLALQADQGLKDRTENVVLDRCEGLFLLARLQMDQLLRQRQRSTYVRTLQALPTTPDALYATAVARIEAQGEEDAELAKRIFGWVYHAREPLQLGCLQYALAIQSDTAAVDEGDYMEWETLASLCGGLVILSKESHVVQFVHPTTMAYFGKVLEANFNDIETGIAHSCLHYFISESLPPTDVYSEETSLSTRVVVFHEMSGRTYHSPSLQFQGYASRNLMAHFISSKEDSNNVKLLQILFGDLRKLTFFWHVRNICNATGDRWTIPSVSISDRLTIASCLGSAALVKFLLDTGSSPDALDTVGQTPLFAAVSSGDISIVRILLENGADANQSSARMKYILDTHGSPIRLSPMECALQRGNVSIARLLRKFGAQLTTSYLQSRSPLYLAVSSLSQELVQFVLEDPSANLEACGPNGNSPLHEAISRGAFHLVEKLVKAGVDVTRCNREGRLPIEAAVLVSESPVLATFGPAHTLEAPEAQKGDTICWRMIRSIVDHHPSMKSFLTSERFQRMYPSLAVHRQKTFSSLKSYIWQSARSRLGEFARLWNALCNNMQDEALEIARDLSQRRIIDLTSLEFEESNILPYASHRGWTATVRPLLEIANRLQVSSQHITQALCEAIQGGHNHLMKILLEAGPDLNADVAGSPPLVYAIVMQNSETASLLLDKDADPNVKSQVFGHSVRAACQDFLFCPGSNEIMSPIPSFTQSMLRLLAQHGAELDTVDEKRGTILTSFAQLSTFESLYSLRLLIEIGADFNALGGDEWTPLMASAASSGIKSLEVLETLLDAGADLHVRGGVHGTALLAAASTRSFQAAEKIILLFGKGADPIQTGPNGSLHELLSKHQDENVRCLSFNFGKHIQQDVSSEGLVRAAASGSLEDMILLIETGADIDAEINYNGTQTSALFATMHFRSPDRLLKMQVLLTYGANLNSRTGGYANILQRYLDTQMPDSRVIECLIAGGVIVNEMSGPDGKGTTLEIAIRRYSEIELNDLDMRGRWQEIILFLYQVSEMVEEHVVDTLFQYSWFLDALTTGNQNFLSS